MEEIVEKVKGSGLIGDLDGDGVQESVIDEIKGKIGGLFRQIIALPSYNYTMAPTHHQAPGPLYSEAGR